MERDLLISRQVVLDLVLLRLLIFMFCLFMLAPLNTIIVVVDVVYNYIIERLLVCFDILDLKAHSLGFYIF